GTAPPAQNRNWGPSNQNYGNSQPNQSNMRNSGQSGNAGYGRVGNNNQGYNNARNNGSNNYQQNYSNPPRPGQQNRTANFGNRQPQNTQGVRVLQVNPDSLNVGGEDDDTLDPNPEEVDLSGQDSYLPKNNSEEEDFYEQYEQKYNNGQMVYPNDGFAQNGANNSVLTNEPMENVKIFSQIAMPPIQENSTNRMLGEIMRKMEDLQQN
ncbi:MAG: hypothetical protein GY820_19685, partial [Gammaproteobacteria bacterium]|nr:hypothetical protein [Gammaproteobacteria bacterium]